MGRCLCTVILVLASATGAAQQPQLVLRATAQLVVQTVSVKDRQGRPVEGLTATDFVVAENGQVQNVAFAEYQRIDATPVSSVTLAAEGPLPVTAVASATQEIGAGPVPGDARFRGRRLIVLYFDLHEMPFFDQMRTFESADSYISTKMTAADMIALLVFDGRGVRQAQAFTDVQPMLRQAIRSLVGAAAERSVDGVAHDPGSAFGENDDAFNIFTTDRQLAALQVAVTDLGVLPEVKTLVYFGSGLRLNGTDNVAQLRATVNAAVRANVTLNPIDARGLVASAPLGDATRPSPQGIGLFNGAVASAAMTRGQQAQDVLYALAKDTGGRAMFDHNDLALGIVEAAQTVTGYYILGYYTRNVEKDGRYRRVTVSLAAGRVGDLSYRAGYHGEKDFSRFNRTDKERQLADALRLEDPITEVPMAAEVNYFQITGAEYFVPVSVRMPGSELAPSDSGGAAHVEIDLIGEVKDQHSVTYRNVRDRLRIPAGGIREMAPLIQYETGFTMLPGSYVVKLLVRNDATGRMGTLQSSFTIPNLEREVATVRLSSVVLSQQRVGAADAVYTVKQKVAAEVAHPFVADGQKLVPAVGRTFSAARPLYVFLEAYERDASVARPLVAYVTCYRDGGRVFESPPLGVEGWTPGTKTLPLRFTIAAGTLAPGSYTCQVTVLDSTAGRAAFRRVDLTVR